MDRCFHLVGSRQHAVAATESKTTGCRLTDRLLNARGNMTSDETQIQIFADQSMSQTRTPEQYAKARISCHCRGKETADRQKLSRKKYMVKPF